MCGVHGQDQTVELEQFSTGVKLKANNSYAETSPSLNLTPFMFHYARTSYFSSGIQDSFGPKVVLCRCCSSSGRVKLGPYGQCQAYFAASLPGSISSSPHRISSLFHPASPAYATQPLSPLHMQPYAQPHVLPPMTPLHAQPPATPLHVYPPMTPLHAQPRMVPFHLLMSPNPAHSHSPMPSPSHGYPPPLPYGYPMAPLYPYMVHASPIVFPPMGSINPGPLPYRPIHPTQSHWPATPSQLSQTHIP